MADAPRITARSVKKDRRFAAVPGFPFQVTNSVTGKLTVCGSSGFCFAAGVGEVLREHRAHFHVAVQDLEVGQELVHQGP